VQAEPCTCLFGAAQPELAQPSPLLDPAEYLLDAAVGVDRLGVALVAGGPAIDGGTTRAAGVQCHVRRDADPAHLSHKAPGVVILIGTGRLLVGTWANSRHRLGRIPHPGAQPPVDWPLRPLCAPARCRPRPWPG